METLETLRKVTVTVVCPRPSDPPLVDNSPKGMRGHACAVAGEGGSLTFQEGVWVIGQHEADNVTCFYASSPV